MEELLISLVSQHPVLASILLVMGFCRSIMKPVMTIYKAYVDFTPSKEDDSFYNKVISSSLYNKVVFLLDYFASIKIEKK